MMPDAGSVTAAELHRAREQGRIPLGFNEPDRSDQAHMTVKQALDPWPRLESTGMRLGAPAVATGGDVAGGWLDRFMKGATARDYKVDFIPLHWYGVDFDATRATAQLRSYLQAVHQRHKKPIWVTEYALIDFTNGLRVIRLRLNRRRLERSRQQCCSACRTSNAVPGSRSPRTVATAAARTTVPGPTGSARPTARQTDGPRLCPPARTLPDMAARKQRPLGGAVPASACQGRTTLQRCVSPPAQNLGSALGL